MINISDKYSDNIIYLYGQSKKQDKLLIYKYDNKLEQIFSIQCEKKWDKYVFYE